MQNLTTLRIIHRANAHGRKAMAGRHTNYGYSGKVLIQTTDGSNWYRFEDEFNARQLGLTSLEYDFVYERSSVINDTIEALKRFGARVVYINEYGLVTLRMKNDEWMFDGYMQNRALYARVKKKEDQLASDKKLQMLLTKFNSR